MKAVRYRYGRFPPKNRDWKALIPLIAPAVAAVARYDGMLAALPSPKILLAPLATREAVHSSRVEGTRATIVDVLEFEVSKSAPLRERRADIHKILSYHAASGRNAETAAAVAACGSGNASHAAFRGRGDGKWTPPTTAGFRSSASFEGRREGLFARSGQFECPD